MQNIIITMAWLVLGLSAVSIAADDARPNIQGHSNFNSTLWVQSSAEYQANTLALYNAARHGLKSVLSDKTRTAALEQYGDYSQLPPAIILDVDETVLDNSPYQARQIRTNTAFSLTSWDHWVSLREARAVPGAVEFINYAAGLGVEIIYVTNRQCLVRKGGQGLCPQKNDTVDNLRAVGITSVTPENVFLKNERKSWTSEKKSRRVHVAKHYRIAMLVGDDLGDFVADVKRNTSPPERAVKIRSNQERWGVVWFMLPNPTYGSWMNSLQKPPSSYLRSYEY